MNNKIKNKPLLKSSLNYQRQKGVALMVSLIFLVILALLGVSSSRITVNEEKISANIQDSNLTFQAAEATLREGEKVMTAVNLPNFAGNTLGLYTGNQNSQRWTTINWASTTDVVQVSMFANKGAGYNDIKTAYFIEKLPMTISPGESISTDTALDEIGIYRVYARATNPTNEYSIVLSSTYRR